MAVTAMKEGAFDFIEKPYNAEYLITHIEKALVAEQELRSKESQRAELLHRIAELSPRQKEVMNPSRRRSVKQADRAAAGYQSKDCRELSGMGHGADGC